MAETKKFAVYLHCWGARENGSLGISKVKKELTKSFDLIAPYLPGNGEAEPPNNPWTIEDYSKHVMRILENKGLTNVTLIGHSFGGGIALKLAELYPNYVSKLYLIEPVLGNNYTRGKITDFLFENAIKLYKITLMSYLPNLLKKLLISAVTGADFKKIQSNKISLYSYALTINTSKYTIDYSNVKCPTYFLWSNSFMSKTPRKISERIVEEQSNFHTINFKGQHLSININPEQILSYITES